MSSSPALSASSTVPDTDLGRDVVGRAAEGARGLVAEDALLAHAEVGDLDVALRVQHHVVQLEISAGVHNMSACTFFKYAKFFDLYMSTSPSL